mgnify:CR=1 FL=1
MIKSGLFIKDDMRIHYEIQGVGPSILCFSGFGCSNYNFDFLRDELSKNFQLILIDNRGMGKSSLVSKDYLIDDLAVDGIELMAKLGIEAFSVMGISMGGFIAQKVALKAADRIQSLVLACTTSGGEDFPALNKLNEESIKRSFELDPKTYNLLVLNSTVHPSVEIEKPKLFEEILNLRMKNMPKLSQVLLQQSAVDKFLQSKIDLSKITCPVLILSGADDRFVIPKNAYVLEDKIPNATLKFIDESDHHFFLEKPLETANVVSEYLGLQL